MGLDRRDHPDLAGNRGVTRLLPELADFPHRENFWRAGDRDEPAHDEA